MQDSQEGLQHVSFGLSDAIVDFQFSITHKIKQSGIINLQVGGQVDLNSGITMGVRKDLNILRGILDKALQQITPEEHNAIAGKWVKVVENSTMSNSAIAVMIACTLSFMAATCFTLLWNISLKRIVEQQTFELNRELTQTWTVWKRHCERVKSVTGGFSKIFRMYIFRHGWMGASRR